MPDNPNLRGPADRSRIAANQPHEIDHAARQLTPEFPNANRRQIEKALVDSAKIPQFHNNRDMVMNSARLKVKNMK